MRIFYETQLIEVRTLCGIDHRRRIAGLWRTCGRADGLPIPQHSRVRPDTHFADDTIISLTCWGQKFSSIGAGGQCKEKEQDASRMRMSVHRTLLRPGRYYARLSC